VAVVVVDLQTAVLQEPHQVAQAAAVLATVQTDSESRGLQTQAVAAVAAASRIQELAALAAQALLSLATQAQHKEPTVEP
jgi:hypothetical protein